MGNIVSIQREEAQRHRSSLESARRNTYPDRISSAIPSSSRHRTPTPDSTLSGETASRRRSDVYGTSTRRVSSQTVQSQTEVHRRAGTDEIIFEQEERPLANIEDLRMGDAPITHIAATPVDRQSSTVSRLGSRFLPNSVMRGLQSSGEETPAEGRAHRIGLQGRLTRAAERRMSGSANGRFSLRETLRTRHSARSDIRRQSMRGPFPPDALLQDSTAIPEFSAVARPAPDPEIDSNAIPSWRQRARNARQSLSLPPLSQIFNRSPESSTSSLSHLNSDVGPLGLHPSNTSDHILPPLSTMDHTLDLDSNGHDLVRSTTLDTDGGNIGGSTASAGASNSSTSGLRRFPHSLRSRSTRIIRPREQPPLAQVLHLAASAIAAQLSGHGGSSMSNMQPLAGNGFDGTIQSFVQTLQQAASAQARGNGDHNEADDGHLPPVNFLRVFSFPNSETGNGTNNPIDGDSSNPNNGLASDRMDLDQGNPDDRTVTLVLVGVRSMPHGEGTTGDDRNPAGTSLDALLNLPFLPPSNLLRNGSSGALLRRSDNRTRFSSRRNSMSNFSSFPQQYDSQRHHRTRSSATRSTTDTMPLATPQSTLPTVLSDSPRGPSPPPSTPAAMSSGQSTPIRRPSSASAMQPPTLPDLSEDPSTSNPREATSADSSHYRRRSDSEFARRPELSSGATRRNGVVEPDTNTTPSGGRSWLIYVVGTNVSPDHPAFTMPSLFTDNPSYEDMQLLSSMLGPVKPPVATQSDVVSSGGLYRLVVNGSSLVAQPQSGDLQPITMQIGERCLICLCDYEGVEEVRQLNKCKHVYHRECIDEWLTTGRNSCPLCRGQGVDEKSSDNQEPTTTASSVA